jgi:hypothetical protein
MKVLLGFVLVLVMWSMVELRRETTAKRWPLVGLCVLVAIAYFNVSQLV